MTLQSAVGTAHFVTGDFNPRIITLQTAETKRWKQLYSRRF